MPPDPHSRSLSVRSPTSSPIARGRPRRARFWRLEESAPDLGPRSRLHRPDTRWKMHGPWRVPAAWNPPSHPARKLGTSFTPATAGKRGSHDSDRRVHQRARASGDPEGQRTVSSRSWTPRSPGCGHDNVGRYAAFAGRAGAATQGRRTRAKQRARSCSKSWRRDALPPTSTPIAGSAVARPSREPAVAEPRGPTAAARRPGRRSRRNRRARPPGRSRRSRGRRSRRSRRSPPIPERPAARTAGSPLARPIRRAPSRRRPRPARGAARPAAMRTPAARTPAARPPPPPAVSAARPGPAKPPRPSGTLRARATSAPFAASAPTTTTGRLPAWKLPASSIRKPPAVTRPPSRSAT